MVNKVTSRKVATIASNLLRNGSSSAAVKKVAGSDLSQAVKKGSKKK